MWLGLNEGQWPVLSGSWVYPAGAIVPMLAAAVGGSGRRLGVPDGLGADDHRARRGRDSPFLLYTRRPDRPQEPPTVAGAWWWLAFLVLLGPVAMGRLDAVVAPVVVVALSIALNHPRITSALLTAAAWVKVAPGALLIALFVAVRRPWRSVVVPAAIVSVVVVGTVAALGGMPHVASFLTEQEERGLQIESPGATPWLVAGLFSSSITRYLNQPIVTWEIKGPGTQGAADVLGALFFVALGAAALLLWWRREQLGAAMWSGGIARTELLVRGAMLLTLAMLVFNKVGSPQYIGWLAPPVAVALALRLPGWRTTAWLVLGTAGATQVVFPWFYAEVVSGGTGATLTLAARNVALVVLLVHTVIALVRPLPTDDQPDALRRQDRITSASPAA